MVIFPSVDEAEYRQSRLCRLLGNPIAFMVVGLLAEGKEMNTSEIANAAGRSISRVSNILGALRLAEVVRYQTDGTRAQYRLKHPRETRKILAALSGFVKTAAPTRRWRQCFVFSQLRKHEEAGSGFWLITVYNLSDGSRRADHARFNDFGSP